MPRLFGRRAELASLQSRWRQALAGRPGLVLVTGQAGYGKTALVEAFANETGMTGALVARTRCHPTDRPLQMEPMVNPATQRPPVSSAWVRPDADGSGMARAAAELQVAETTTTGGAYAGVAAYLRRLTATRPVLIVIEDIQWADGATIRLVRYAVCHLTGSRTLIIATGRTEAGDRLQRILGDVADQMTLGPLQPQDIAGLAATLGQPDAAIGRAAPDRRTPAVHGGPGQRVGAGRTPTARQHSRGRGRSVARGGVNG
jgi:predicted ATPase